MAHDVEEDFVFALKVVVEAAFAELKRRGNIVHGGRVVAPLLKEASSSAQDLLAGID